MKMMSNEQLCILTQQGDTKAQNLLIKNNLPYIKKTAYELWNAHTELNRIDLLPPKSVCLAWAAPFQRQRSQKV